MALEVLCFSSLFRNNKLDNRPEEGRVAYGSAKSLWLFALIFHYCFLFVFIRHFRFFLEPVPLIITGVEFVDSILQIGVPTLYLTDVLFVVGVTFLLARRLFDPKVAYISLAATTYFPAVPYSGDRAFGHLHALLRQGGRHRHQAAGHRAGELQAADSPEHRLVVLHALLPGVRAVGLLPLLQAHAPGRRFPEPHPEPAQQHAHVNATSIPGTTPRSSPTATRITRTTSARR